jgi:hypothetical protein
MQVGLQPAPGGSHVSGAVTTPSPQRAMQSVSVPIVAPGGQHPSPAIGVVIGVNEHVALQVVGMTSASVVQAIVSLHAVGHAPGMPAAMPVSHASVPERTPSPHVAVQSLSVAMVAPAGQQPSPFIGIVIGVNAHVAVHVPPFMSESDVHAIMSLHAVGHAPGMPAAIAVSQVSPASTIPLLHITAQSMSVALVAAGGQQPSPSAGIVIPPCTHSLVQSSDVPAVESVVQASMSSQSVGQAPAVPPAIPGSHSSTPLTRPSPHSRRHSGEQPSSAIMFESSQSSMGSMKPLPHRPPPSTRMIGASSAGASSNTSPSPPVAPSGTAPSVAPASVRAGGSSPPPQSHPPMAIKSATDHEAARALDTGHLQAMAQGTHVAV